MSKERELKINACWTAFQSRLCAMLLLIGFLTISSACLLQGKNVHQESSNDSTVRPQVVAESPSLLPLSPARFNYVQLFNQSHWLVAELNRVLKTEDAGRTWTQIYIVKTTTDDSNQIRGLCFVDERVGFLIVGGHLVFTDNGGTNWADLGAIRAEKISFRNCYFTDAMRGWAVGMTWQEGWVNDPKIPRYVGSAFATQDGGRTWRQQRLDLPKGHRPDGMYWGLNDVLFKDAKTGWFVGDRGTIFSTEDGGETWRLANAKDVDYQSVNFLDGRFGWATYKYGNSSWGVAMTTDGGQQWKLLNESLAYGTWPVCAVFLTPEHGFAVSLKLYDTKDGGRQWNWRSGGDNVGEVAFEYFGQARDGTLVALGLSGNSIASLVSTDGGTTWQSSK
jgi:photosystem II stability/assembly factor-like uncharacterized protein